MIELGMCMSLRLKDSRCRVDVCCEIGSLSILECWRPKERR